MKGWKWAGVVVAMVLATQGFATEGGGGAYPNGAEGFMTGAVPPPGQYLVNYMLYYGASDFMDGNGAPLATSAGVDPFDLKIYAEVLRLINVTKVQVAGASWAQHVFIPIMYVDVDPPAPGVPSDDEFGLGDIIVDPCVLAWHTPEVHLAVGLDVYVPIGKYDSAEVANIGRNYWTLEPVVACTYRNKDGIEASAKLMYDFNFENDDTNFESGDEFHFDYVVAKHFGNVGLGLGGYFYKQITDDSGTVVGGVGADGPVLLDAKADLGGYKGSQWAYGPQISYQHKNMSFVLKWQHEDETEWKPEGDRFWVKFITNF